jgi:tetraacyldisaccharide 4'-kinase
VNLSTRVVAAWYAPRMTLLAALLWPLSMIFRGAVATRRAMYRGGVLRAQRLPVPVVVVGNITVGGSGKTPLACALGEALAQCGFQPGFVSRGYGGSAAAPREVVASDDPAIVGDEPLVLAATGFPVWIGHDRAEAGRGLLDAHRECDVVVCDDGLQHYGLARTVEIAVVDMSRGFGNGLLLPAGPLREPPSRLDEVDAVVQLVSGDTSRTSDGDGHVTFTTHVPLPWRNLRDPTRTADPAQWQDGNAHAVAGIAHPQRFFAALRAQGIVAAEHAFADHHSFTAADLDFAGATAILMTQKDAVKCARFADERFWYLPVRASLDPALIALVEHRIRGSQTA